MDEILCCVKFTPKDLEQEVEYIKAGGSLVDPVFGDLSVSFDGLAQSLESGSKVELKGWKDNDKEIKDSVNILRKIIKNQRG